MYGKYFWLLLIVVTCVNGWLLAKKGTKIAEETGLDETGFRKLGAGYSTCMSLPWLAMGIGLMFGGVPSPFSYLHRPDGDPFILLFYLTILGVWLLGFLWIFFAGGYNFLNTYYKPLQQSSSRSVIFSRVDIRIQYILFLIVSIILFNVVWGMDFPDLILTSV